MVLLGQDYYGTTTYGAAVVPSFDVSPFVAKPNGYGSILVTWTSPTGTGWSEMRLVTSSAGFPTSQYDGTNLLTTTAAASQYNLIGLQDSGWHYFALFLKTSGANAQWIRVGTASCESIQPNHNSAAILMERIPDYFHFDYNGTSNSPINWEPSSVNIVNQTYGSATPNQALMSFLQVLGYGLDTIWQRADSVLDDMNVGSMRYQNLDLLAQTLGIQLEYSVPATLMRERVANAGYLASTRGTSEGMRSLVDTTVGYDVDITMTPNLMLSDDQATFTNPEYVLWSSGVNYNLGAYVEDNGNLYRSKVATIGSSAGGTTSITNNNQPSGANGTLYWVPITQGMGSPTTQDTWMLGVQTGVISAWSASTGTIALSAFGISSQADTVSSNSLKITPSGGTATISLKTLAAVGTYGNTSVVGAAIPIPQAIIWNSQTEYPAGTYVTFNSTSWKAIIQNQGYRPDLFPEIWTQTGIDSRVAVQFSYYGYAPSGSSAPTNLLSFYDAYGNKISDTSVAQAYDATTFYDTFSAPARAALNGTSGSLVRGGTWVTTNQWMTEVDAFGNWVAVPVGTGSALVSYTSTAGGNYQYVAATFQTEAAAPHRQYLVVNQYGSSPVTYIVISRSGIGTVATGAYTELKTFATPITDGTRVVAQYSPTTGAVTVYYGGNSATLTNAAWVLGTSMNSGMMVV